ncbi:hypothetical protein ACG5V6_07980 [Streptomyces chitinivorans]|uniref:Secreted protein n=1 Tax=Streptomyces chitinivorans TaxID=1257027 RepID=A0ABW7HRA8_9ACTN|nr:hypothetical protein [Streptomyces chitinivorans]MDH2407983.1 hypothetical protein [Streptomyces chitinivorans]
MTSTTPSPERSPVRRTLLVTAAVVVVAAAAAIGSFAHFSDKALSDQRDKERRCCWAEGATPQWMSEVIGVRVPKSATDRRAGYKIGSRLDTGLLAFTLPSQEADEYLAPMTPEGTEMIGNFHPEGEDYKPAAAFAHLGLPEPETIVKGMRLGGFCPDDVGTGDAIDTNYCVDIFAHEFTPGSTRIYLRSTIEPGVSPLPTPVVSAN